MTANTFVHLHIHSEFSIIDGLCRIPDLIATTRVLNMPALALTDQNNLFAMVKFYQEAMSAGLKPIFAAQVNIEDDEKSPTQLVLLCQNDEGFANLKQIISHSYLQRKNTDHAVISKAYLQEKSAGLIALSCAQEGDIGRAILADQLSQAEEYAAAWAKIFPNRFYIELQRIGKPQEEHYIQKALLIAQKLVLPIVATNNVRFLKPNEFEAHEARVCIHAGQLLTDPKRTSDYTAQQYLRSASEMKALFSDLPESLENSVEIAKRCNVNLKLYDVHLPHFPVPGEMSIETYLKQQSLDGLDKRFPAIESAGKQIRLDRLTTELEVINNMGFAGYFLIVADFIQWAKSQGIPVGPGRGSGAGSLVAYVLGITDLDPLQYDLLFERFLNPERVSMPDFDIDFCMDRRDEVIEYVTQRYGRDSVSQIITFGTMAAKAVVRDVGRVLGHPYGFVDKIAKLVPFELGITLEKALDDEKVLRELYDQDEAVHDLIDLALQLEGIARNAGKHAGGVVIAPGKLTDFTPIYCESGSEHLVCQLDKDDVETIGLVKFDFLGLRTLTIIDWAARAINQYREQKLDITQIPLDCPKTFALLQACQTTAVFQLESRGMKDLIKRLQPDTFEDIIALVALFRPGPLQSGMVDDFINRKHGRARVEYPHQSLKAILEPTYGVILYQEQVMQIAQTLSGYSLGSADILRRAMGKKKPEEMAQQREIFVKGAVERGVAATTATYIFDIVEKFAGYGFNKSHSAAYALLAYQTAYLKAHYPAEFMAAVLSSDMDNTDKVVMLIEECRTMKIEILPPNVNHSEYYFVARNAEIIYGLGAIKGLGENAIESIIISRKQEGQFTDIFDFCARIDLRKANRRALEALIKSGALDDLAPHRATLLASLDKAIQLAEKSAKDKALGQGDLFAQLPQTSARPDLVDAPLWSDTQRLLGEKATLGLYLTGHPITEYLPELKQFITCRIIQTRPEPDKKITIAGFLTAMRVIKTKQGKRMAIATLDDQSARMDVTLFNNEYEKYRDVLETDALLVVQGVVMHDEYTGGIRMKVSDVFDMPTARTHFVQRLLLKIEPHLSTENIVEQLVLILKPHCPGKCPVFIQYTQENAQAQLKLGEEWRVNADAELLKILRNWLGHDQVILEFAPLIIDNSVAKTSRQYPSYHKSRPSTLEHQ
jgi:DNA polymerase-3 subunit alpha